MNRSISKFLYAEKDSEPAARGARFRIKTGLVSTCFMITLAALISVGGSAGAGSPPPRPDSGSILESIRDKSPVLPEKNGPAPVIAPEPAPAIPAAPGMRTRINGFRITGSTVFDQSVLQDVVAAWKGKELSFKDMNDAVLALTAFYQSHGYIVARAYLPPQQIRDGVLEIGIVEGKIDQIEINRKGGFLLDDLARDYMYSAVPRGSAIREDKLNRGLLLLNDLPAMEVQSVLKPGSTPGTTDLVLELNQSSPFSASVGFDNYGDRYTGANRYTVELSENSQAGIGELVGMKAITSGDGLFYIRLAASLPLGSCGTRAGTAFSAMRYRLGGDLSDVDARGQSEVESLYLLHPIVRSRSFNLYAHLQGDHKDLTDKVNSTGTVSKKEIQLGMLALEMESWDGLLGGGLTTSTISYYLGNLRLRSEDVDAIDQQTARTDGTYQKATALISRQQKIWGPFEAYGLFNGQIAFKNLDSSEKFSLGGPYGVRSYPVNEAQGDHGYILTGELRYNVPEIPKFNRINVQLVGFVDYGKEWANEEPWDETGHVTRELSGAGLGINLGLRPYFSLRASYAWKLGHEAAQSDSDRSGRFWLQAVLVF